MSRKYTNQKVSAIDNPSTLDYEQHLKTIYSVDELSETVLAVIVKILQYNYNI